MQTKILKLFLCGDNTSGQNILSLNKKSHLPFPDAARSMLKKSALAKYHELLKEKNEHKTKSKHETKNSILGLNS